MHGPCGLSRIGGVTVLPPFTKPLDSSSIRSRESLPKLGVARSNRVSRSGIDVGVAKVRGLPGWGESHYSRCCLNAATTLLLKGSLFDEELLGALVVEEPPEAGDFLEHDNKSYAVTDVIHEGADAYAPLLDEADRKNQLLIVIVEPLAVSQRRVSRFPPKA